MPSQVLLGLGPVGDYTRALTQGTGVLKVVAEKPDWDALIADTRAATTVQACYVKASELLLANARAELAVWTTAQGRLVHPYVRRPIAGSSCSDLFSPFEYGGFFFDITDPTARGELIRGFEPAFRQYAQQEGIVSEFCRAHPFHPVPWDAFALYRPRHHSDDVVVHLHDGYDAIWRDYKKPRRRLIRQGRNASFVVERSSDFTQFVQIYHTNLDRLQARREYYFPKRFFDSISGFLELYYLYTKEGRLVAAHSYLIDGPVVFAYLCHSDHAYRHLRPSDFLYDHCLQRFVERGFRSLHFGGGADSLRRFKESYSPSRVPYHVVTAVFDPKAYEELVAQRRRDLQTEELADFFPEYRAGAPDP